MLDDIYEFKYVEDSENQYCLQPIVVQNLNASQKLIMDVLKNHPSYTIKDMVKETALSDGYVRKILSWLKENEYLKRVGSKKNGGWKIKE